MGVEIVTIIRAKRILPLAAVLFKPYGQPAGWFRFSIVLAEKAQRVGHGRILQQAKFDAAT